MRIATIEICNYVQVVESQFRQRLEYFLYRAIAREIQMIEKETKQKKGKKKQLLAFWPNSKCATTLSVVTSR